MIQIGENAPAIVLPDEHNDPVALNETKGRFAVLYFYPRDLTPGCTLEAEAFQKDLPRYEALDSSVYGISVDSPSRHVKFKEKYGLTFPLLSDEGKSAVNAFDLLREKNMYGKKVLGVLRSTFIVDEGGKIVYAEYGSKPLTASENALAFLMSVQEK